MLLKAFSKDLIKDYEKTYLTASVAVAGVTLTVKSVDTNAWADNDWIIVGDLGTETAEVLQLNGAVSDGTSLTIDNAGSGGARYAHSIDEPVYRVAYNQVEFSRATTIDGSKTVLATNEIQPDDLFTRYEDTANTTGFGFIRFKNSLTSAFSVYSIGVPYTGYPAKALFKIIKGVKRLLNIKDEDQSISDDDIIDELNEKQRDVYHERLWSFAEETFSFSAVANTADYALSSIIAPGKVHTLSYDSQPLAKINANRWEMLHWDTVNTGDPSHFSVFGNRLRIYPLTSSAASTTTLNGAITATDTSITLTSGTNFRAPGRMLIESEVISYDYVASNVAYGCRRGLEGTTAATHADTTAVTERDFIGTGHKEPVDMVDMNDETDIPDPRVLEYGAAMELALVKQADQVLHDRLKLKYENSLERLRDKFSRKISGSFFSIKDKSYYPSDTNSTVNPNNFPTGITD